jgi:glycosidase
MSEARRIQIFGRSPLPSGTNHFHVRRSARDACGFEDTFFAQRGDVIFETIGGAARFSQALRAARLSDVGAADLRAMGLLHEILHAVVGVYRQQHAGALRDVVHQLRGRRDVPLDDTLRAMLHAFPPPEVYRGQKTIDHVLLEHDGQVSGEERAVEELLLLYVANQNPVYRAIEAVVSDQSLRETTGYAQVIEEAEQALQQAPKFGGTGTSLLDLLLEPARKAPDSVWDQLAFMRGNWSVMLKDLGLFDKVLVLEDMFREEAWLGRPHFGGFGGESPTAFFAQRSAGDEEYERFSPDTDWMPNVVMVAKSTFVWLHQLSRTYDRPIRTLADIPDAELSRLAGFGINALWLIGLWRRSRASQRIKQMAGNHQALASAYSLDAYDIAEELGGHHAYQVLRDRAARHGLRLASDMVPNHMGLDSEWVKKHPQWFLQTRDGHPAYPNYTFTGADLGDGGDVGVVLEDGYWSRTDAAVTFKRFDRRTGEVQHIYHGNDGTSMPWNDTAQLDYSRADVREAVIQTILHVARMFPIIRFDAAMTLAKKHVQRLWFPLPGDGGAIPSRADYAVTKEQFDAMVPQEFWREVVDRVAVEAPGTLLLAEAFWLMEGYFVRTLGMHRVYNSAFMNMLKKEDNQNFRLLIKNVLEFEPQVLKRFVNFMNNPDEESAVAQFGTDDKYFGACVLMCTMPGLPMIGHGQFEGFREKYGMEYARPMMDEEPNGWLVARHEREIVPLLRRRELFSEVDAFYMYDCDAPEGHVNEDVIAYSNRRGNDRTLVLHNNRFGNAVGRLRQSCAFRDKGGNLGTLGIGDGLDLGGLTDRWLISSDACSGLEHLYPVADIVMHGFPVQLGAFKYAVFWNMRFVFASTDARYDELYAAIGHQGVPSIEDELVRFRERAVFGPLRIMLGDKHIAYLLAAMPEAVKAASVERFANLAKGLAYQTGREIESETFAHALAQTLARAHAPATHEPSPQSTPAKEGAATTPTPTNQAAATTTTPSPTPELPGEPGHALALCATLVQAMGLLAFATDTPREVWERHRLDVLVGECIDDESLRQLVVAAALALPRPPAGDSKAPASAPVAPAVSTEPAVATDSATFPAAKVPQEVPSAAETSQGSLEATLPELPPSDDDDDVLAAPDTQPDDSLGAPDSLQELETGGPAPDPLTAALGTLHAATQSAQGQAFLRVHESGGIYWFHQESFEALGALILLATRGPAALMQGMDLVKDVGVRAEYRYAALARAFSAGAKAAGGASFGSPDA